MSEPVAPEPADEFTRALLATLEDQGSDYGCKMEQLDLLLGTLPADEREHALTAAIDWLTEFRDYLGAIVERNEEEREL